jgi:transcriptional regulator with XRE-family HTH domain
MEAVRQALRRRRLRQRDAAALFGVAQPRVSDLVRGKVALFSIDTLVDMLAATGVTVELKLRTTRTVTDGPMAEPMMPPPDQLAHGRRRRGAHPGRRR